MIKSFADKNTERFFNRDRVARFASIEKAARKGLIMLNRATSLNDLANIPGNRLEKKTEFGRWGLRINQQYRILFRWDAPDAYDVEITDYH